jgi:hypothetical protein
LSARPRPPARAAPRRPTARAPPRQSLGRSHRVARRARRNDHGKCGASRAARIPIRPLAVAATDDGRRASGVGLREVASHAPRLRVAPDRRRGAHDGPRRAVGWQAVRRGRGTARRRGRRIARGLPLAHQRQALGRGHRFARRARRNDGGKCGTFRAARIPARTLAVAAAGAGGGARSGPPASGCAKRQPCCRAEGCTVRGGGARDGPRRAP